MEAGGEGWGKGSQKLLFDCCTSCTESWFIPSLKRSPWAWVFLTLSDPARSTRWNFAFLNSLLKKKEYRVRVDSLPFLHVQNLSELLCYLCIFVCVWLHELSVMQTHSQLYYYFLIFNEKLEYHHQSHIFVWFCTCSFHCIHVVYQVRLYNMYSSK